MFILKNEFSDLNEYEDGKPVVNADGTFKQDTAKSLFNDLSQAIAHYNQSKKTNVRNVVYRDNPTNPMVFNKWANSSLKDTIAQNPGLKNQLLYSDDFGGGGLSARRVINGVLGVGSAGKVYNTKKGVFKQDEAIAYIKNVGEMPNIYKLISEEMAEAVFADIIAQKIERQFVDQSEFYVDISATGKVRNLADELFSEHSDQKQQ